LKLILSLVKPRYFIPIHGEYRHLVRHAQLALDMGMPEDEVIIAQNGNVITFESGKAAISDSVHSGRILVDGKGVGDVGEFVLRDRRRLSGHGVVIVLLAIGEQTGEKVFGPEIISRGFVFEEQGGAILEDAKCIVLEVLNELDHAEPINFTQLEQDIARRLKRFFYSVIERRPIILPLLVQV
jgi:ribonuclease J